MPFRLRIRMLAWRFGLERWKGLLKLASFGHVPAFLVFQNQRCDVVPYRATRVIAARDEHTWPDLFHGDGVSPLLAVAAFIFVLSSDSIG